MNDIEHDLRTLFHERADRIVTAQSAPEQVLRRGRRRQLGTVVLSSLGALMIVSGSIVGLRDLLSDRPSGGAGGRTSAVIARGDASGLSWTLSSWIDDGRYCTRLGWRDMRDPSRTPPGGSASCGGPPGADRATFSVNETETSASFLVALVPRDVLEVLVESEDAQRFSTRDLVDAPPEWGALRFAVVPLEGEGPGAVHFIGAGHDIVYPSVGFRWGGELVLDASTITHATMPDYVTDEIGSIELEGTGRTLFAWQEGATSKFCLFLQERGSSASIGWCSTAEFIEDAPILSIGPVNCQRRLGVLWGTVPADVAAIRVRHRPSLIETIAGPPKFGHVRFVLGSLEEPYPGSAGLVFLDASGKPVDQDWLSGSCLEDPPEAPEA